jgi:hypothetical protein
MKTKCFKLLSLLHTTLSHHVIAQTVKYTVYLRVVRQGTTWLHYSKFVARCRMLYCTMCSGVNCYESQTVSVVVTIVFYDFTKASMEKFQGNRF